jgi:hypothetical protein
MKNVTLTRNPQLPTCTTGVLIVDDDKFTDKNTAEPIWAKNQIGKSCVYADVYNCTWQEMQDHPGHFHYMLENKHGRNGVFIHYMSLISQSRGCIALCTKYEATGTDEEIDNSVQAVDAFESIFLVSGVHQPFTLTIVDNSGDTNLPTT